MFTYIVWQFLILETFVLGELRCPCKLEYPQKQFCNSELVLKVVMHERIMSGHVSIVTVDIKKVFKGDVRNMFLLENRYVVFRIGKPCGHGLMVPGREYVVFGYDYFGSIGSYAFTCYGVFQWWSKSGFLKRALEADYYKDNCDCAPELSDDPEYISWQNYCEWRHSYMRKSDEKCNWVNSTELQTCLDLGFECVWPYIGIGPNIWIAWYRKWFEFIDYWIQPKYRASTKRRQDGGPDRVSPHEGSR